MIPLFSIWSAPRCGFQKLWRLAFTIESPAFQAKRYFPQKLEAFFFFFLNTPLNPLMRTASITIPGLTLLRAWNYRIRDVRMMLPTAHLMRILLAAFFCKIEIKIIRWFILQRAARSGPNGMCALWATFNCNSFAKCLRTKRAVYKKSHFANDIAWIIFLRDLRFEES